jgi:hypothetical protein
VLTVVTSGKAAPGVTTSTWALALTWPGPLVVADCDPAGGDMAPGLLAGRVSTEHGLLSWSASARRGIPALTAASMFAQHVVQLPERQEVWFLPGFTNATQGFSFTDEIWERLSLALERSSSALGRDALVDAGRLVGDRGNWPVLRGADHVLLAVRPSVRSVHAAQYATRKLRYELGDLSKVSALVVGSGPYSSAEVASALQLSLGGVFPDDRLAAAVLSDGAAVSMKKQVQRSALLKAAGGLAKRLATPAPHPDAGAYSSVGGRR